MLKLANIAFMVIIKLFEEKNDLGTVFVIMRLPVIKHFCSFHFCSLTVPQPRMY